MIAVTAIAVTSSRITFRYPPAVHETLVPKAASYLGVFEAGRPAGTLPDYHSVETFADMARQQPNLVAYYSGWAQPFNVSYANMLHGHGAIPFVQIDPSFAKVSAIPAGDLRHLPALVRRQRPRLRPRCGHRLRARDERQLVLLGMGAPRPSRGFHGGLAAHRHGVPRGGRLQRHLALDRQPAAARRHPAHRAWWPGTNYVTWVGIDGYYVRRSDTFQSVFGQTITQVQAITHKPILLSETGVSPKINPFAKITDLFNGLETRNVLGVVWFDENQPDDGLYHQDWRIEGNSQAQAAFQQGIAGLKIAHT